MQVRNLIGTLLSAAMLTLTGCGGGGGGGGGGVPVPTNGTIISTAGTTSSITYPFGIPFITSVNHAYSVELVPTGVGDPDLLVTDALDPASSNNFMDWSMNSNPDIDVVSFIGNTNQTLYASVVTYDVSATYTLNIFDNQLTAGGSGITRRTKNSAVYFTFDAVAGQAYNVTVTPVSGDPVLSVYSGTNPGFMGGLTPDSATLIGTSSNPGTQAESVTFMASATQTYYIEVDNNSSSAELDFTTAVNAATVNPDLRVSINSVNYNSGNMLVGYTVSNTGLAGSTAVNLGFWLNSASAPVPSTQAADSLVAIAGIPAGSSINGTATIPVGALTSGTLWAYVDPENVLAELDETNNVAAQGWAVPLPAPQAYDFESGIPASFITTGDAGWQVDSTTASSGSSSIRAQTIGNNQTACIATTVANSSTITFDWKVSSEQYYDYLYLYIDGIERTGGISGVINWSHVQVTGLTVGTHEYKWCYSKDGSLSANSDTGWVDNISIN